MSEPFVAEISIVSFNFSPRSWAFCDGQLLPIAQNTALFSLIGTTYGGDGRSTTALPNLMARAPMHPGRGPGLTSRRLGDRTGVSTVTLTKDQIPSHDHLLRVNSAGTPSSTTPGSTVVLGKRPFYNPTNTAVANLAEQAVGSSGGGQSHYNLQPLITMNFIIALQGLYPSRS